MTLIINQSFIFVLIVVSLQEVQCVFHKSVHAVFTKYLSIHFLILHMWIRAYILDTCSFFEDIRFFMFKTGLANFCAVYQIGVLKWLEESLFVF